MVSPSGMKKYQIFHCSRRGGHWPPDTLDAELPDSGGRWPPLRKKWKNLLTPNSSLLTQLNSPFPKER